MGLGVVEAEDGPRTLALVEAEDGPRTLALVENFEATTVLRMLVLGGMEGVLGVVDVEHRLGILVPRVVGSILSLGVVEHGGDALRMLLLGGAGCILSLVERVEIGVGVEDILYLVEGATGMRMVVLRFEIGANEDWMVRIWDRVLVLL